MIVLLIIVAIATWRIAPRGKFWKWYGIELGILALLAALYFSINAAYNHLGIP
jgi:hypothetical protein